MTTSENDRSEEAGRNLTRQAEDLAGDPLLESVHSLTPDEARSLVHELRVHQIELEMQNNQLRLTQAELEMHNERFRALYDLAPVGFVTLDGGGVIQEGNRTAAVLFGVGKEALVGQQMTSFIDSQDQDLFNLHQRQLAATGQSQVVDLRLRNKLTGGVWWACMESFLIQKDKNGTGFCRTIISDVTDRKKVEQDLQRSEESFQRFFENTPIGFYRTTPQGEILLANAALLHILGYQSLAELTQRNLEKDYFEPGYSRSHFRAQLESQGEIKALEAVWKRQDGSTIYIRENARVVHSPDGQVLYYEGSVEDISQSRQAQLALQESETRYRRIVETSYEGIWVMDQNRVTTYVNQRAADMLGYKEEEIIGRTTDAFIIEKDIPDYYQKIQERKEGKSGQYERRYQRKDGSVLWTIVAAVALADENGAYAGSFAMLTDITERKLAEVDLDSERELMNALMDTIPDQIYFKDAQSRFLRANRATAVKVGVEKVEDMIGKTDFDYFTHESAQEFRSIEQEIIRTGLPAVNLEEIEQRPGQPPAWVSSTKVPLRDAAGQVIGVLGISRDITERKKMEQALAASEERLRLALEAAEDGLWDWNIAKGSTYHSPRFCSMLGYTPEELPPNDTVLKRIIHPDDMLFFEKELDDYLKGLGETHDVEFRALQKNGEVVWIRSRGKIVERDAIGKPIRMVGTHVDITQRKNAEEALRQSEAIYRKAIEGADGVPYQQFYIQEPGFKEFKYAFIGEGIRELTGYGPEEFTSEVFDSMVVESHLSGELSQYSTEEATALVRAGTFPYWKCEWLIRTRDGKLRWLSETAVDYFDQEGLPTSSIGLFQDITASKQAEEALRTSQAIYRQAIQLADAVPFRQVFRDATGAVNTSYDFIGEGIERLTGYSPAEFTSEGFDSMVVECRLLDELAPYPLEEAVAKVRSGAIPYWKCEWLLRTPEGKLRWVFEASIDQLDEKGVAVSSIGLFQDITVRKQRDREVEAIATLSAALRSAVTRAEMLPVILDQVMKLFDASGVLIAKPDALNGELMVEMARGVGERITHLRIPPGKGIGWQIVESGKPYLNNAVQDDPNFLVHSHFPELHALAGVPLNTKRSPVCALMLIRSADFSSDDLRLLTSIADIAANALDRAALFDQTEQRLRVISAVQQIDSAISSSMDLRVTFNVLLTHTLEQLHADAGDVLILDPHLHRLDYLLGRGFLTQGIESTHLRIGECLAGRAVLERRSAFVPDLRKSTSPLRSSGVLDAENFIAYHVLPLIAKGEVKGVLELFYRAAHIPEDDALNLLETIAGQAAIAIDNSQLFQDLQRSNIDLALAYDATIEGWARALDLRNREVEGHTQRVTEMTERLAVILSLSWEAQAQVRRGALLHDIGKMGVPDAILLKEDYLDENEAAILRQHPQIAFELLSPISFLRRAMDIPYCHHERWDGAGYPLQLKGSQIPMAARIFAVADAWDAITSFSSRRCEVFTKDQAIQQICSGAGKQFDPQVVEAFLGLIGEPA